MSSASLRLARPIAVRRRFLVVLALAGLIAGLALTATSARADGNPLSVSPLSATTRQGQSVTIHMVGSGPAGDTLYFSAGQFGFGLQSPVHGTLAQGTDGVFPALPTTVIYTPAAGFIGQDTFTYRVSDSAYDSAPATVTVTVTAAPADNRPPTAAALSATVETHYGTTVTLAATDPDGDRLSFSIVTPPAHGSASVGFDGVTAEYQASGGYFGSDSFTYTASDGALTSAPALVTITVVPDRANTPPTSVPPTLVTAQDTPIAFQLTGSDVDGDPVSVFPFGDPQHGTLTGSGTSYVYTPAPGFAGDDSFQYDLSDGRSSSSDYTVHVTVTPGSSPVYTPSVDTYRTTDERLRVGKLVSPPLTTGGGDRLLLAFVSADGPAVNSGQRISAVTGGGLTWTLVRRSNSTWGTAEVWQTYASAQVTNLKVTAKFAKSGYSGEIAVVAYSGAAHSVGASASAAATTGTPGVTVTPTKNGSLVWAVGHDWTRAGFPVPPAGQTLQTGGLDNNSGDTYWTQSTTGPATTTAITLGSTYSTTDRWQMVAVEVPSSH